MPHRTRLGRRLLGALRRGIGEKRLARYRRRLDALALRLAERTVRLVRRVRGRPSLRLSSVVCIDENSGARVVYGTVDPGSRSLEHLQALDASGRDRLTEAAMHRWPNTVRSPGASPRCERFAMRIEERAVTFVRATDARGRACRRRIPVASTGAAFTRIRDLLEPLRRVSDKRCLHERVTGPAIERVMASRTASRGGAVSVWNAQHQHDHPRTTLIIPIHGRHDFIEHQLARFANDAELLDQDILYVIDDPRLHPAVIADCERWSHLYRVPFRTLCLHENLGYAGANNVAAAIARGRYLLLLNSDVMPIEPGWLGRMHDSAGDRIDDALVGARLLYDDGTVQHDGMRFFRSPFHEGLWLNLHPGKGLPESLFPTAPQALSREAVTAACLLLSRKRWDQLGGLDERYVLGDFEDSDLCLKARAAGLPVLLCTNARLQHLERQSQSLDGADAWREELTWYNGWQHATRWQDELTELDTRRAALATDPESS